MRSPYLQADIDEGRAGESGGDINVQLSIETTRKTLKEEPFRLQDGRRRGSLPDSW